ncbi:MAG: V-type ATP synthase subunit E family protein [Acholeplasma sp.]|nr:V-type ATP synthase subunit E family protein [Acholeplasma sp.]
MELVDKIIEKGNLDVEKILLEAKEKANDERTTILDEAKKDYSQKINTVRKDSQKEIKTKERLLFFETKQAELLAKQSVIDDVFKKVEEKITNLIDDDLLDYVYKSLKKEELVGNEIFYTNKEEYKKFLKALSSETAKKSVDLDKLNALLKTKLVLSNQPIDVKGGFIIESKDFDLNFTIEEVISKLREKHEGSIIKELFE